MAFIPALVARVVGWTASVFFHVETKGKRIPGGPVLVTANHPNSLLDPLLVFRTVGRPARPLAKAPLFEQAFVGSMLKALGGLPVYRKQDDAALMHRNDETFRRAIDALRAGDAVQIFPEGRSHSEPGMVTLRTGAARIALGAESQSNWALGLKIVPVGITYRRKSIFRGSVIVVIGDPFTITDLKPLFESDEAAAARVLTDRMTERLHAITLNLSEQEDHELIDTAEVLYAHEKGLASPRKRGPMTDRMPRLQRFAHGLAWLRAREPERFERLKRAVMRYRRVAGLLGVKEADVPRRYPLGSLIAYGVREALYLLIGAPVAILGSILWYPPYLLTRIIVKLIRPEHEAIATYKLASGFFAFPIALIAYIAIAWSMAGGWAAAAVGVAVPLAGFVALAWRERWARVREDLRLFALAITRRRTRDRLAHYRVALVREFDAIAAELDRAPGVANIAGGP